MKCQAALLLLGIALCGPLSADPATEVREIRRLLQSRGETLDARTLKVLETGKTEDLAQLRRQLQHLPPPVAKNIGQGRPTATARKLNRSKKLNATRKL